MKTSIVAKLALGLALAVAIFVSSLNASLADVLAPLPVAPVDTVSAPEAQSAKTAAVRSDAPQAEAVFDGIYPADLLGSITEELERSLRPNGNIMLNPLRDLPELGNYAKPFNITLLNLPSRLGRGNLLLRFQVENEKGVIGEWSVPFAAHVYSEVWVARSHLRAGSLAAASDLEVREVDLLAEPDAVPARMEVLMRHEYSRDIAPGRPLQWKDLAERSLVRKGDIVEITAIQGLLAITMRAMARSDGGNGDIILFRNMDSAKDFPARVVSEGRAEVVF